jgi:hypothetical protein
LRRGNDNGMSRAYNNFAARQKGWTKEARHP